MLERRLIIVSNRLPVSVRAERGRVRMAPSAGGLATAMAGVHAAGTSLWVGWPGDLGGIQGERRSELDVELKQRRLHPVVLTRAEVQGFYDGFSNQVLWPLFHHMPDRIPQDARDWEIYRHVNQRFADEVARQYRPGDLIWVHDYQLMLVPGMLRKLIPDAQIGFFLHIPFPAYEIYRALPWREELVRGMLGADLVGFHIAAYQRHFCSAALLMLGIDSGDGDRLEVDGRSVKLGAFPIGIDVAAFEHLGQDEAVLHEAAAIRASTPGCSLLVGVDRLDYTKGIPRRLLALERLLEREPARRGRIQLLQIAVPSRDNTPEYQKFRRDVNELVGRINSTYGTLHTVPIRFLYRSVTQQQLVGLYRAADVMVVSPLRDGMNLVAKEFVAARTDEDGVLLLSEFAGAAADLRAAEIINPFDIDGFATGMSKALDLGREDRRTRMRLLRQAVMRSDVSKWSKSFIDLLKELAHKPMAVPTALDEAGTGTLLERLRAAPAITLLLDYDGTLVEFSPTPNQGAPDGELLALLGGLARRPDVRVHIVSGRRRKDLEQWFGDLDLGLHAEHGFWSRWAPGRAWLPLAQIPIEWKGLIRPLLQSVTDATPGALLEEKSVSLAWHFRQVDRDLAKRRIQELNWLLREHLAAVRRLEVLHGDETIEVRLRTVNKGQIVSGVIALSQPSAQVLAIGDDRTDEDLFAALPEGGISIHVGAGASRAQYSLKGPAAVRRLLSDLLVESAVSAPQ